MASKAFLVVIAALAAVAAPAATAKEFVVGDDDGWKLDYNYNDWATGKQFYVGDTLVFNYPQGAHNVIKVNQTEFEGCEIPLTAEPLNSGFDNISLKEQGKKWYICGVGQHCSNGMKLVIDVMGLSEAPAPGPSGNAESAAIAIAPSKLFSLLIGAGLVIFLIILA